jgi:hypothetical protein
MPVSASGPRGSPMNSIPRAESSRHAARTLRVRSAMMRGIRRSSGIEAAGSGCRGASHSIRSSRLLAEREQRAPALRLRQPELARHVLGPDDVPIVAQQPEAERQVEREGSFEVAGRHAEMEDRLELESCGHAALPGARGGPAPPLRLPPARMVYGGGARLAGDRRTGRRR